MMMKMAQHQASQATNQTITGYTQASLNGNGLCMFTVWHWPLTQGEHLVSSSLRSGFVAPADNVVVALADNECVSRQQREWSLPDNSFG